MHHKRCENIKSLMILLVDIWYPSSFTSSFLFYKKHPSLVNSNKDKSRDEKYLDLELLLTRYVSPASRCKYHRATPQRKKKEKNNHNDLLSMSVEYLAYF